MMQDTNSDQGLDRRTLLGALATLVSASMLQACSETAMTESLWRQWLADWQRMEAIVNRRGWTLTPLAIAPPASEAALSRLERRHRIAIPAQLRAVLAHHSAQVRFGWHIPSHLQPLERQRFPRSSCNRGAIWDLAHIDEYAIPSFLNWKAVLADRDRTEAPNRPEMWEGQFPFYGLVNGDVLTIDVSKPDGPQPVRYFSHDLETLHGLALAPDFFTFITEMSRLGFAGTEWASWMPFGRGVQDDTFYLSADTDGARAWLAWLARDAAAVAADEPPSAVVETTAADRALLVAARSNIRDGVVAALAAGAKIDAVWNGDWLRENGAWAEEFCTAVTYAARHDNVPLLDLLLKRGATLNTRRLPLGDAVEMSAIETVRWLIAHGARVDGWRDDRLWPLHRLVTRRAEAAALTRADYERSLRKAGSVQPESIIQDLLRRHIDGPTYDAMLEALLGAGAKPDAPWDNGITMLMWGGVVTARLLLGYGANVEIRDARGQTAMHWVRSPEKVRVLVVHGADVNALSTPPAADEGDIARTPVQAALLGAWSGDLTVVRALLDHGANPRIRDGRGRSTLVYCTRVEAFELIRGFGLDPLEPMPGGGTLLHELLIITSVRATSPEEVAFLDHLLGLGLDINGRNAAGQTMLHIAAERVETPDDIQLLLDRGADKGARDAAGRRPVDLVPRSLEDIRQLLV